MGKEITDRILKTRKEIEDLKKDLASRESAADIYGSEIVCGEFCSSARFIRNRIYNLERDLIRLEAGIQ